MPDCRHPKAAQDHGPPGSAPLLPTRHSDPVATVARISRGFALLAPFSQPLRFGNGLALQPRVRETLPCRQLVGIEQAPQNYVSLVGGREAQPGQVDRVGVCHEVQLEFCVSIVNAGKATDRPIDTVRGFGHGIDEESTGLDCDAGRMDRIVLGCSEHPAQFGKWSFGVRGLSGRGPTFAPAKASHALLRFRLQCPPGGHLLRPIVSETRLAHAGLPPPESRARDLHRITAGLACARW